MSLTNTLRRTLHNALWHCGGGGGMAGKGSGGSGDSGRVGLKLGMDGGYDYYGVGSGGEDEDPDELFGRIEGVWGDVGGLMGDGGEGGGEKYEGFLEEGLMGVVYGSNAIEKAGSTRAVTEGLCGDVFSGREVKAEIGEGDAGYETTRDDLVQRGRTATYPAVIRARREVIQHALALRHILLRFVAADETLSEELILSTHGILCEGVDLEDGEDAGTYAGVYRSVDVRAGFTTFVAPSRVAGAMRALVLEFNREVCAARERGVMDPFMLGAKYCHKLVNIHPFVDGNGRMCRLLLNAILVKYAGVVVPLGESEEGREEYLGVAIRASEMYGDGDEDGDGGGGGGKEGWAGLASLVLREACGRVCDLGERLRGVV